MVVSWLGFADDVTVVKGAVLALVAVLCAAYLAMQAEYDLKDALVVLFCGLAALSIAWSPDWRQGVVDLQSVVTACLVFLTLRRVDLPPWSIGAAVLLALNPFLPHGGAFNENTQAEFLLLGCSLLFGGILPIFIALAALAFVFLLSPSHMAWAVLAGIAFLALVRLAFIEKWRAAAFAALVLGLSAVIVGLIHVGELRWMFLPRVQLLAGTVDMWASNPLFGNGLGSFNYLWPRFANADISIFTGMTFLHANDPSVLPGTAHNEFLQVLSDLGIVGFGLFLAVVFVGTRLDWRSGPALLVLGVFMAADAPLHDPQTMFLGAYALAIASPLAAKTWKLSLFSLVPASGVLLASLLSALLSVNHARADVFFGLARLISEERSQYGFALVSQAVKTYPFDHRYRLQLFPSVTKAVLEGKIRTTWPDLDVLFTASKSAVPESPALLMTRLYILRAGEKCGSECADLSSTLQRMNPRMLAVWDV